MSMISTDREGQTIEMKIAIVLNETVNMFMSEYHQTIESMCVAYQNRSREELTAMVDHYLVEKRADWEKQCLETLRAEVSEQYKKFQEKGPLGSLLDLLEGLR